MKNPVPEIVKLPSMQIIIVWVNENTQVKIYSYNEGGHRVVAFNHKTQQETLCHDIED